MSSLHIKAEHPLGNAHAFAAALAMKERARVLTGDPDFEVLEEMVAIR